MKNSITKVVLRDATVIYMANENVNVYPSTKDMGKRVKNLAMSRKGRMTVAEDGSSHFQPFSTAGKPRYRVLTTTEHGAMKATQSDVKVCLSFPQRLGAEEIRELLIDDVSYLAAWLRMNSQFIISK